MASIDSYLQQIEVLIQEMDTLVDCLKNKSVQDNLLLTEEYRERIDQILIEIRNLKIQRIQAELGGSPTKAA